MHGHVRSPYMCFSETRLFSAHPQNVSIFIRTLSLTGTVFVALGSLWNGLSCFRLNEQFASDRKRLISNPSWLGTEQPAVRQDFFLYFQLVLRWNRCALCVGTSLPITPGRSPLYRVRFKKDIVSAFAFIFSEITETKRRNQNMYTSFVKYRVPSFMAEVTF